MSQHMTISNPNGAFKTVADFRLPVSDEGELVVPEQEVTTYRANAAVAIGQALMWVAPTATVPVSVSPMTSAIDKRFFAGVALEAAAAGEDVLVGIEGHFLISVGATTPAASNFVIAPDATTGVFGTDATPDATDSLLGINWGVKDANNLAFAFISRRGLAPIFA